MADRWATFDCYGTLIDWDGGVRAALHSLWPEQDADELLRVYHEVEPAIQAGGNLPYRAVLKRSTDAIATRRGLSVPAGQAYALPDSLPAWDPFPETAIALRRLRDTGWRLGILSNTDPDLLAASLERIGVPVDVRITAAEAGSYKPAPGHWQRFFRDTGADRSRHVHVAASLFHDIAPAADLGLTAVWINRLGETSNLPRAAELPDLVALPETLERLVPA